MIWSEVDLEWSLLLSGYTRIRPFVVGIRSITFLLLHAPIVLLLWVKQKLRKVDYIQAVIRFNQLVMGDLFGPKIKELQFKICVKNMRNTLGSLIGRSVFKMPSLQLFSPTNVPIRTLPLLWASKRGSWNALFDQRPEFILKGTGRQDRRLRLQERILNALGHTRLTRPSLFGRLNTESRQLLVLLSCLAARRYRDTILSDILESPLPVIRGQIAQCQSYKWIDDTRHLTQLGKDILVAARRNQCIPSKEIELKEDFYYPITLRSPESSPS